MNGKASRMAPGRPGANATPLDRARQLYAHLERELERHRPRCYGEDCPMVVHRQHRDAEQLLARLEQAAIEGRPIA